MGSAARANHPGNTTADTTEPRKAVAKRPQPHGGALNAGGTPGNKGGRPPSVLRELARGAIGEAIPQLRLMAIGDKVTVSRKLDNDGEEGAPRYADVDLRPDIHERMAAFDRLLGLGMGEEIRTEDVRKRLERQAEILGDVLSPASLATIPPAELLGVVMARIGEAWQ